MGYWKLGANAQCLMQVTLQRLKEKSMFRNNQKLSYLLNNSYKPQAARPWALHTSSKGLKFEEAGIFKKKFQQNHTHTLQH